MLIFFFISLSARQGLIVIVVSLLLEDVKNSRALIFFLNWSLAFLVARAWLVY